MASFDGGERCNACGGARGHSPELSLELAPVARSLQGLHLHDLQRMGDLTNVFAGVDEVGRGLGMRKRTQREMARLGGSLWCSSGFGSSPGGGGDSFSSMTSLVGPRHCEARRRRADGA
jgi:hypothetical protein